MVTQTYYRVNVLIKLKKIKKGVDNLRAPKYYE